MSRILYGEESALTGKITKGLASFWLVVFLLFGHVPLPLGTAPVVEAQALSPPSNLTSVWRTDTSVHLTWTASSSGSAVIGYDVYNGNALIGSTSGSSDYWATGLTPGGSYTFTVRAKDASGNVSAPSSPFAVLPGALDRGLWTATASSSASGAPPSLAVDGSLSTRWSSGAAQASGMWFQIDTGPGDKTYHKLVLDAGVSAGDYPRGYEVSVSDDGANWSAPIVSGAGSSSVVSIDFPQQTARYVRVTLTKSSGPWWSIYDLNLYGAMQPDTQAPTVPGGLKDSDVTDHEIRLSWNASTDNVAVFAYDIYLGPDFIGSTKSTDYKVSGLSPRTAYSFTIRARDPAGNVSAPAGPYAVTTQDKLDRTLWKVTASSSGSTSSPGMAVDGILSSRWTSGAPQAPGTWFQIDTGPGDKTYNKLLLDAGASAGDYPRGYEVTVSDDGVNWSAPVTSGTGTSSVVAISFPQQTAKYIRITLTKTSGLWWSIHELHLYGVMAPDDEPPTTPAHLTATKILDTEVDLTWEASTDNVAVVGYNVYAGSTFIGYTSATSYKAEDLTAKTAYTFTVRAKDLSGNLSPPSAPLAITTQDVIALPLVARYEMESDPSNPTLLRDDSGYGQNGTISPPASFEDGREGGGKALKFTGPNQAMVTAPTSPTGMLNNLSSKFTISAWIKPDDLNGHQPIVTKRDANWKGSTFYLRLTGNRLGFAADYGEKWYDWSFPSDSIVAGQWCHVAVTFEKNVGVKFYVNGKLIGSVDGSAVFTDALPNFVNMMLGTEWHWDPATRSMRQYGFRGSIDSLHIYAAPLTSGQIKADMANTMKIRPAEPSDFTFPEKWATFRLVRYDMPNGLFTNGSAKIHQTAVRKEGPDAVDWPRITLNIPQADQTKSTVEPFADGAEFKTDILLQREPESMPLLQEPYDNVLQPGNHWIRGVQWRWGQTYMYTADRTARSWAWDYELWTFPVKIEGTGPGAVKNVVLKADGAEIYNSGANVYDSLTLLLPQNEDGKPYELWVDGRGPVRFDAGLQPVEAGNPKDVPFAFALTVPGSGPAITVKSLDRPETFPNQAAWDADAASLSEAKPVTPGYVPDRSSIARHLGVDVPRSPETINFVYMSHGMSSGGFYHSEHKQVASMYQTLGSVEDYADYVSDTGYDRVFEFSNFTDADSPVSQEKMAAALEKRGVQFGFVPLTDINGIDMRNANLAFYAYNLPDYRAPLYRNVQLSLQRFQVYPNMTGISIGADNADYVPYWDWAPPIPNRPWGMAYTAFQRARGLPLTTPIAPSVQGWYQPKAHEYFANSSKPFLDYIDRYDETFKQYGYFVKAVSEVNDGYITTTGSFGSSPGVGGHGGWPWGTVPAKPMHDQMPVQTGYDWNELNTSKPMHVAALLDRLRSYYPNKTTWAIPDDFSLFFGKMDREKAYALALTRGIQAIGTNVLPNNKGDLAKPQMIAEQKELYSWIRKYGGAYAMTEPTPTIGIMYVNKQALLRGIVGKDPTDEDLLKGSHEGKVTEAMFFTHAAGWSSKVITPEELKKGLPSSIKAILLVGLNNFDDSWHWYDDGIAGDLQGFVDRGGLILKDDESVSPVPSVATGMQVRAYLKQSDTDQTNLLLERNADNIVKLKSAMASVTKPVAVTDSSTVWAIPTRSGDTQYVTVVDQKHDQPDDTQHLIGQTGSVTWNTERPIYDVRKGRKLTVQEATYVDLKSEGFQWYALPPAEITVPSVTVTKGSSGFYEAFASVRNPDPMTGIPVELTVTHQTSGDTATVYSATGLTAKLPLKDSDQPGTYTVTVKELLSGLSSGTQVVIQGSKEPAAPSPVKLYREDGIREFAERTNVPLTVALTAAQNNDPAIVEQANRLVQYYRSEGRQVRLGLAEPNGAVTGLQEYKSSYVKYPQWKTIESDLVLIGNTSNNVLLLDQARGYLLFEQGDRLSAGGAAVSYANSPFVGEYHTVNIIANDLSGIKAAVNTLIGLPSAALKAPKFVTTNRISDTSVELAWSGSDNALGYTIERRDNGDAEWQQIGYVSSGMTSFNDSHLTPDKMYAYRLKAFNLAGVSDYSEPIRVITTSQGDAGPELTRIETDGVTGEGKFNNKTVAVTFVVGDRVKTTKYKLNNNAWKTVTGAVYIADEGIHTLQYYSEDKSGNVERTKRAVIGIDKKAPVTVANVPRGWKNTPQLVQLRASDNLSGVAKTFYSVSNGIPGSGPGGNVSVTNNVYGDVHGDYTVTTNVYGNVYGNYSIANNVYGNVYGDYTVTTNVYGDSKMEEAEGSVVPVTLEGINMIRYYSIDAAGNKESVKTAVVTLDYTPPKIELVTPLSFKRSEPVRVKLQISDALSGVSQSTVTFNGRVRGTSFVLNPYSLPTGDYALAVKSFDRAGNYSEKTFIIRILDR